jgi:hypothetical protein
MTLTKPSQQSALIKIPNRIYGYNYPISAPAPEHGYGGGAVSFLRAEDMDCLTFTLKSKQWITSHNSECLLEAGGVLYLPCWTLVRGVICLTVNMS